MNWPATTKVVLLTVTAFMLSYSVLAAWIGGKEASVSFTVRDFVSDNPIVALIAGIIIGHVIWHIPK